MDKVPFDPKAPYLEHTGVRYSRHAFVRISERLSYSTQELAYILLEKSIPIGMKEGKTHRLFWDTGKQKAFVAVMEDGCRGASVVVTVLPWDYHENCAWQVSPELEVEARRLTEPSSTPSTAPVAAPVAAPVVPKPAYCGPKGPVATRVRVTLRCRDLASGHLPMYNVGGFDLAEGCSPLDCPEIVEAVLAKGKQKMVESDNTVVPDGITFKRGSRGDVLWHSWHDVKDAHANLHNPTYRRG